MRTMMITTLQVQFTGLTSAQVGFVPLVHLRFLSLSLQLIMEPGDVLGVVDLILSVCKTIYNMANDAKANKKRCQQIAERVKVLEDLVLTIRQRGCSRISSSVFKALKELRGSLDSAQTLIRQFSRTKAFVGFVMSSRLKDRFDEMDSRLTDNLQVLSGALLIEQGDVLHEVYQTVRGRKQPPARSTSPTPSALSSIAAPDQMSVPTAATPACSTMPPMQMCSPTTVTPVSYIMAPMPVSSFMTPIMPLPGAMTPVSFSTTVISSNARVSPDVIKSLIGQQSLISINPPMTFSTQNLF